MAERGYLLGSDFVLLFSHLTLEVCLGSAGRSFSSVNFTILDVNSVGNLLLDSSITAFEKSLLTFDFFPCSFDKVAVE